MCPSIPEGDKYCAVLWDKEDCKPGTDWDMPYFVPETSSPKKLRYGSTERNDADSVSVRRGCTFTVSQASLKCLISKYVLYSIRNCICIDHLDIFFGAIGNTCLLGISTIVDMETLDKSTLIAYILYKRTFRYVNSEISKAQILNDKLMIDFSRRATAMPILIPRRVRL